MLKKILITIFICSAFFEVYAQTDTSDYNPGRISLKRKFTQSITIKGSDLERTHFDDLADAINVWLYGTYTSSESLIYVVDGNTVTDVNAYSIYDVDQVTLVQNALAQTNGAAPGQQMVLITLKRNHATGQGIEAAAQAGLVSLANRPYKAGYKSSSQLYDQYYFSGYKRFGTVNTGFSADYQHDALPALVNSNYSAVDPMHFNRLKINGYIDAALWKGTTVNFGINYAPQKNHFHYGYNPSYSPGESSYDLKTANITQHQVNTDIALNSRIVKGLVNTLSAAYAHYNYFENDSLRDLTTFSANNVQTTSTFINADDKSSNLLVYDNLVYRLQLGGFSMGPMVNFSYRKYKGENSNSAATYDSPGFENMYSSEGVIFDTKRYLLTPAFEISYKDGFDLLGGFSDFLNSSKDFGNYKVNRFFPFLSTSIDVFKLAGVKNVNLQFFASFSRTNLLLNAPYSVFNDFAIASPSATDGALVYTGLSDPNTSGFSNIYPNTDYDPLKTSDNYDWGISLGISKKINVTYSYQSGYNWGLVPVFLFYYPDYQTAYYYFYDKIQVNRVSLNYKLDATDFKWQTGINVAQEKLQSAAPNIYVQRYETYISSGHRYSGGFTNRFTYKHLFAGFDILYQLGQRPITLENVDPSKIVLPPPHVNSVSLQNFYFGTMLKINQVKYAEVYASFRNILQNNSGDITDNRRFYGIGLKVDW